MSPKPMMPKRSAQPFEDKSRIDAVLDELAEDSLHPEETGVHVPQDDVIIVDDWALWNFKKREVFKTKLKGHPPGEILAGVHILGTPLDDKKGIKITAPGLTSTTKFTRQDRAVEGWPDLRSFTQYRNQKHSPAATPAADAVPNLVPYVRFKRARAANAWVTELRKGDRVIAPPKVDAVDVVRVDDSTAILADGRTIPRRHAYLVETEAAEVVDLTGATDGLFELKIV